MCGGRDLLDPKVTPVTQSIRLALRLRQHLTRAKEKYGDELVLVHGDCSGGDQIGQLVGEDLEIEIEPHPADWDRHGKKAGYLRNAAMERVSDVCLALPGGPGTAMMVRLMKEAGKPVAHI